MLGLVEHAVDQGCALDKALEISEQINSKVHHLGNCWILLRTCTPGTYSNSDGEACDAQRDGHGPVNLFGISEFSYHLYRASGFAFEEQCYAQVQHAACLV